MVPATRLRAGLAASATAIALLLAGCSAPANAGESAGDEVPEVAIILFGLADDGGFNEYATSALGTLADEGRIELQIRESVTNPTDAEQVARQYAADGADLVIGWGLGFSESIIKVSKELPDTDFIATGAPTIIENASDNLETWTYDFYQYGYLLGWILGQSQLSPWAIVDAELAPYNEYTYEVARTVVKQLNPDAVELDPVFTGSNTDTQVNYQGARAQIDLGARIIVTGAYESNSGIIAAAVEGGVATLGASNQASANASSVNLGSVDIDWLPVITEIVDRIESGEFGNTGYSSDIANGGIVFGNFNEVAAAPDFPSDIEARLAELATQIAEGSIDLPQVG